MDRNLKLYPIYQFLSHFIVWMPIFFLYFNELVSLKEVILLEAIYYISVVILEVPSGYFSDAVGRKITLTISAFALLLAGCLYILGTSFIILAIAQFCFACWMAFQSGTNTVFHYETLKEQNLEQEYGDREAKINKYMMLAGGSSALIGGFAANYNLMLPYYLTIFTALVAVVVSLYFKEPKKLKTEKAEPIFKQLKTCSIYLKKAPLGWLFAYLVLVYIVAHVPYEFYQPYLKLLQEKSFTAGFDATLISGILYAGAMFVGAWASGISMNLLRKFGYKTLLMFALVSMLLIVGLLATWLHPVLLLIILLRNAPRAIIKAPVNAFITPKINAAHRATFYSIMSLANRFAFFICLYFVSTFVNKTQNTDWETLSMIFWICFVMCALLSVPIILLIAKKKFSQEN